jgi:hypothetical protein
MSFIWNCFKFLTLPVFQTGQARAEIYEYDWKLSSFSLKKKIFIGLVQEIQTCLSILH